MIPFLDPITCVLPDNPPNGRIDQNPPINYGDVITYSCDSDFVLNENLSQICEEDGQWSGTQPHCIMRNCTVVAPNGTTCLQTTPTSSSSRYLIFQVLSALLVSVIIVILLIAGCTIIIVVIYRRTAKPSTVISNNYVESPGSTITWSACKFTL